MLSRESSREGATRFLTYLFINGPASFEQLRMLDSHHYRRRQLTSHVMVQEQVIGIAFASTLLITQPTFSFSLEVFEDQRWDELFGIYGISSI